MGGIVIAFPGDRARTRRGAGTPPRPRRQRSQLKAQIGRIVALLEELDALSGPSIKVPPAMVAQARNSIGSAEHVLGLKEEHDPQPYIEPQALERVFNPQDKYQ